MLPILSNADAWARLPGAPDTAQPLPAWARVMAGWLPVTTARMLELDAAHRTGDRLDARLRGLARWAAADANRCEGGRAIAAADLRRDVGADPSSLLATPERLSPLERAAVPFARRMMLEAHAITDEEFAGLLELAGEERTVALVALLAYASFQDRLLLAMNPAETDGPPPVTVTFARPTLPPPSGKGHQKESAPSVPATSEDWRGLQEELEKQRERPGRIRVPSREEVLARIGEKHPAAWQAGILWSRVCYGYQPELTDAWFSCIGTFRQEAGWEPVFAQAIFWVVTRSLKCFY